MLVLAIAIGLLFLLAVGLTGVTLLPGEPFLLRLGTLAPRMAMPGLPGAEPIVAIARILLALSIILFPIYLVISILTREGRRRLLLNALIIVALILFLSALRSLTNSDIEDAGQADEAAQQIPAADATPLPEPVFSGDAPEWTVLVLTLAVSLILVGLGAGLIWLVRNRRQDEGSPLQRIAVEAQQAIDALQSGDSLEETVVRCYRDMCRVVQDRRGLKRDSAMTPSEFEQALRANGLPREAVHQITHLFEEVRYGARRAGERERAQAIDSLSAIVAACGGPAA
jgi:hypothetical protein